MGREGREEPKAYSWGEGGEKLDTFT